MAVFIKAATVKEGYHRSYTPFSNWPGSKKQTRKVDGKGSTETADQLRDRSGEIQQAPAKFSPKELPDSSS